jgi:hypothetical protein
MQKESARPLDQGRGSVPGSASSIDIAHRRVDDRPSTPRIDAI